MRYVCELCGTVYDEAEGDVRAGIQPGTEFSRLPEDYTCRGCGYQKEAFDPIRTKKAAWMQERSVGADDLG